MEAAGLAHDIGHPPFGHIAEEELDAALKKAKLSDGFEGNPQSFRIVTRLAALKFQFGGLHLTRATLGAILKYPWYRQTDGGHRERKWGAYHTEEEAFNWARQGLAPDEPKTAEAELMDWADDIAYAVHDVEDFYRAGLIPLDRLAPKDTEEEETFFEEVIRRSNEEGIPLEYPEIELRKEFQDVRVLFPAKPYEGTQAQRGVLRTMASKLIERYVGAIQLRAPDATSRRRVSIDGKLKKQITVLKELTWHYVIRNPSLATIQHGQRRVIRELFSIFHESAGSPKAWAIFSPGYRDRLKSLYETGAADWDRVAPRLAADYVAGMTEQQAIRLHQRLTGSSPGSTFEPILHLNIL